MGRKLAEAGIQATVISDSAVFAMMARANKVGELNIHPGLVSSCVSVANAFY